jgi:hypothetical protein
VSKPLIEAPLRITRHVLLDIFDPTMNDLKDAEFRKPEDGVLVISRIMRPGLDMHYYRNVTAAFILPSATIFT